MSIFEDAIDQLIEGDPEKALVDSLRDQHDEVILLAEGDREVNVLDAFNAKIEDELHFHRNSDPRDALANPHAWDTVKSHKPETIAVLEELRRRAFGKVVTLKSEDGRQIKYRVAQANYTILTGSNGEEVNVVNRLAPVARKLAPAEIGELIEIPQEGVFEVIAIDLLDRYETGHLDNFSQLQYLSDQLEEVTEGGFLVLNNVRGAVEHWKANLFEEIGADEDDVAVILEGSSSLGSSFYTRTTKAQEELMNRPPRGVVIVEGIAGSGKTSVALGRVKQLHDARLNLDEDEVDTFFSDQSRMVGFVLHKQLISYLEITLNELGLSHMKVLEFKERQSELLRLRAGVLQLKMPGNPKGVFSPVSAEVNSFETSMKWLRDVERQLTIKFIEKIRAALKVNVGWIGEVENKGATDESAKIDYRALLTIAWQRVADEVERYIEVVINRESNKLLGEGIARRLKGFYERFFDLVSENARWYFYDGKWHTEAPKDEVTEPLFPFSGREFQRSTSKWLKDNVRDRARTEFRQALYMDARVESSPKLSSWYLEALTEASLSEKYGEKEISVIRGRVNENRLSNADLNTLLAVTQIFSKGHVYSSQDQKRIAAYLAEPEFFSTVFIDEVQDFSEIEVFLMSKQADPDREAVTVVGDFRQQLYPDKVKSLADCFPSASSSELEVARLVENKRQTKNLANHSLRFRERISEAEKDTSIPEPVLGSDLSHTSQNLFDAKEKILSHIEKAPQNSIAVILPTDELAQQLESELRDEIHHRFFRESTYTRDSRDLTKRIDVHFTTPRPTKGLEFDVVVAPYFNLFDLSDPIEANAAYVTVSRPRERLHILDIVGE